MLGFSASPGGRRRWVVQGPGPAAGLPPRGPQPEYESGTETRGYAAFSSRLRLRTSATAEIAMITPPITTPATMPA